MYYKGTVTRKYDRNKNYIMKDTSDATLEKYHFRYVPSMSSADESIYDYVFPAYRYNAAITLDGRFLLFRETGRIVVDVFDSGTKGIYGPWYHDESGLYESLNNTINRNIAKEMRKLKIVLDKVNI